MSQLEIWRIVIAKDLWRGPRIAVSDEAVYRRFAKADDTAMALLFEQITALLLARHDPADHRGLAPFATAVVAIDETTLDPIARSLPSLRGVPLGSDQLLPGKLAAVFDLRRQLFRAVTIVPNPHQNEKVLARDLVATLPAGSLILADLGYFGFKWFDDLTDARHCWISRLRGKTSTKLVRVLYDDGETYEALVWLGAYQADRAKHMVRLVRFRDGTTEHSYLTNVHDPQQLPITAIAELYARRWDIELAVKLVKRDLGLHLLWSAKPNVIAQQIWAVLLIAQLALDLRERIAERAKVPVFDVSMTLLLRHLPAYAARYDDPIGAFVEDGRLMKFIRPSTRIVSRAPTIPPEAYAIPPTTLRTTRKPRYAQRNCGKRPAQPN